MKDIIDEPAVMFPVAGALTYATLKFFDYMSESDRKFTSALSVFGNGFYTYIVANNVMICINASKGKYEN